MSGGHFDYVQFQLEDPARELRARVALNGKTRLEAREMLRRAEDSEDWEQFEALRLVTNRGLDFWSPGQEVWDQKLGEFRLATPEELLAHNSEKVQDWPEEVAQKFLETASLLDRARVVLNRVDWLLSGEDGEEQFLERLASDLAGLEKKKEGERRSELAC